jgi:DNA-directed RNA polymerase subunit M/transcription elongation factor TFIIS
MFKLTIETDNAAFDPYPEMETARILRVIAEQIEGAANAGAAVDINGNRVGSFTLDDVIPPDTFHGICNDCSHEGGGFIAIRNSESDAPVSVWFRCPKCGHDSAWD